MAMRPKGSQFEQLQMFDVPQVEQPPPYRGGHLRQEPDGPFHVRQGETPADNPWGPTLEQSSLPNAMEVVQRTGLGTPYTSTAGNWEWVPTENITTLQPVVDQKKLNALHGNIDRSRYRQPEGQETFEDYDRQTAYKFNGDEQYQLLDGNHRTTVERHQGALFHRMHIAGEYDGDLPKVADPPGGVYGEVKGEYKP